MKAALKACVSKHIYIPPPEMAEILEHFEEVELAKGDCFAEEGKLCSQLAFIYEGVLRVHHLANGEEITLWMGMENSFITSLSSFIFQTPSRWDIQAVTPVKLLVIERGPHMELTHKFRSWVEFDNIALSNAYAMLEQRMFDHLHTTAEERYLKLLDEQPSLFNRVPLQYIASMLGIKPETLSRLRKKLAS